MNNYYTYAYLREDRTPYYIGKGKERRAYIKNRKGAKPPKNKNRIIILKNNLTEEEAFKHEIYMIAVFGRKDLETGILHNKTNGGDGTSGALVSNTRKEVCRTWFINNNPMKDPEVADKVRQYLLSKHPRKGIPISAEQKNKIANTMKERRINVGEKSYLSQVWKITFDDGRAIKQTGLRTWAKDNNYSPDCLYNMAKGKQKRHKNIIKVESD
jgi:hypothetical protein